MEYWLIYTLKLKDDCWYVGRTTQKAFKSRMNDHWRGKGSNFTILHPPIRIYDIQVVDRSLSTPEAEAYENKQTIKMASIWGKEYVRGGGYCQAEPRWPIELK
jgi:predicted GIY-YIG superfamily endonuclease